MQIWKKLLASYLFFVLLIGIIVTVNILQIKSIEQGITEISSFE